MADETQQSDVLACPHCGLPLLLSRSNAACASGHSFDRAKGGYLNLLVGGRLSSGATPGDTPDALAARRRFLLRGGYAPIAAALTEAVGHVDAAVLDVGCGEGYYTSHLPATGRYGLDVSKRAVQMAARLLPDAMFVVGSAYRLPVQDHSLSAVTSVFAPHPLEEFVRVLRPGGRWVTVTPGPMHLVELRPSTDGAAGSKALDRQRRRGEPPDGAGTAQSVGVPTRTRRFRRGRPVPHDAHPVAGEQPATVAIGIGGRVGRVGHGPPVLTGGDS